MIPKGRGYVYAYTKITCKIDGADEDVAQTAHQTPPLDAAVTVTSEPATRVSDDCCEVCLSNCKDPHTCTCSSGSSPMDISISASRARRRCVSISVWTV